MSKLRVLVDGEWREVDAGDVELIQDDDAGEVVDGEVVIEPVSSLKVRNKDRDFTSEGWRREMLRSQAAWVDG